MDSRIPSVKNWDKYTNQLLLARIEWLIRDKPEIAKHLFDILAKVLFKTWEKAIEREKIESITTEIILDQ